MVNVIIPVYRARATLPQALDSLVAQTKKMFLVTIMQDCDGESYNDIIAEYERRGLQIKLLTTPSNLGPGGARQYGMDHDLQSEYFLFLDADDMFYPRTVEILSREAKVRNADIITSTFIAERNHEPGIVMDVDTTPVTWMHGKIYRAGYLRENNIRFLDELKLNEDSYFNLVAINSTDKKFKIKEPTYLWRDNGDSLTRSKQGKTFFEKSWEQYLRSQVEGLKSIVRIRGTVSAPLTAATLNNMYTHTMQAFYYKIPTDNAKKICLELKDCETVIKNFELADFWKTVHNLVKGSLLLKNDLIFFKMRFCDWLNVFILDKEVSNESICN